MEPGLQLLESTQAPPYHIRLARRGAKGEKKNAIVRSQKHLHQKWWLVKQNEYQAVGMARMDLMRQDRECLSWEEDVKRRRPSWEQGTR